MSLDESRRLFRPLLWTVLGLSMATALLLQTRLLANLDYQGENSGCESSSLFALQCLRDGRPLYQDFRKPPHVIPPYMPAFFGMAGVPARALGLNDLDTFLLGRGIVYVAWLAVAALIWLLTRQHGATGSAVWLPSLLWLGSHVAHHWAISVRPDAPALALSLLAVYLYGRGGRWASLWVVVLLSGAFFVKQSSVAALAVVAIEELLRGRTRSAGGIAGSWAVLVAAGVWATQVSSGGNFLTNVFFSQTASIEPAQVFTLLRGAFVAGVAAFVGAGLFFVTGKDRFLKLYFLVALLTALAGSAKLGAYTNYYLEPFAIACVLTGLFLQTSPVRPQLAWLGIALAAGALTFADDVRRVPAWWPEVSRHGETRRAEQQRWENLLNTLRTCGQPVLVEDPYLAVRLSHSPFMVDLPLFAMLAENNRFDDSDVRRQLATSRFAAVVLLSSLDGDDGQHLLPGSWRDAMRSRYRLEETFPMRGRQGLVYHLYVPGIP
jgi:hypothetical protein